MLRRSLFALALLAIALPAYSQEEPSVIFLLRDSARGNDYQQGDVVEVFDGNTPCSLPPAAPFWIVKITGITLAEAVQYMAPEYQPDGSMSKKRLWQIKTQRIPRAYSDYFLGHRFIGFGGAADQQLYGTAVAGDFVIPWAEARTWLVNKTSNKAA